MAGLRKKESQKKKKKGLGKKESQKKKAGLR
jgi:hypothetical protein